MHKIRSNSTYIKNRRKCSEQDHRNRKSRKVRLESQCFMKELEKDQINNEERKYICGKANEFIKIRKCVLEMLQYIRI